MFFVRPRRYQFRPLGQFEDDADTILLLQGEDGDGSTTFTDRSSGGAGSPHTVNVVGNMVTTNAQRRRGWGCIYTPDNTSYLQLNDNADWTPAGDLTLECFIRFSAGILTGTNRVRILRHFGDIVNNWRFQYEHGSGLVFRHEVGGSVTIELVRAFTPTAGVWYHVAVMREGDWWSMGYTTSQFRPSDVLGPAVEDATAFTNFAGPLYACVVPDDSAELWIDDLRFSKVARYTTVIT